MMVLVALFSLNVNALNYDITVDGICYVLDTNKKSAMVTNGQYSGRIVIPSSINYNGTDYPVTSIGGRVFYGKKITSVTIPSSIISIGSNAFYNCVDLRAVYITDLVAWCNITFHEANSNPLQYAHHLYLNGEEVKDLVIPSNFTTIGSNVFSGCSGLTSVTIPNSVTTIDDTAFSECTGLTSVTIPNSVTTIGNNVFYGCTGLTTIDIPNSVTSIGSNAFNGCSSLKSVTIPNSITTIRGYTFNECGSLTSVDIPNSVTKIGNNAFQSCTSLKSIDIPSSVTTISSFAFCYSGLTSIDIPNSVTSIEPFAFYDCNALTSATIGNSVKEIGNSAFHDCDILTTVTLNCNNITSDMRKAFGPHIKSYVLGNTVTWIGYQAFQGLGELTSVTFGNSIKTIDRYAFQNCTGLNTIVLPSSITEIGDAAFMGCANLTDFYCYAENVPQWSPDWLDDWDDYRNITLHVPRVSIDAYKQTSNQVWGYFRDIVALPENGSTGINTITAINNVEYQIFTADGKPVETLQKGVNIIRYSDGQTKKVYVK